MQWFLQSPYLVLGQARRTSFKRVSNTGFPLLNWSNPFEAEHPHTPPRPILRPPTHAVLMLISYTVTLSLLYLKFYHNWEGWQG